MVQGTLESADIAIGTTAVALFGVYGGADARVMLYGTPPVSAGTTFVKNKLRLIYTAQGDLYDANDAYTAYVAKFGVPSVGDKVFLGAKYVLPTGQASPRQSIVATVSA
jgi:hypothetical protein